MALRVGLPLTKDTKNQGASNITTTSCSASINNNGKLGKCYYFDANYIELSSCDIGDELSICYGAKYVSLEYPRTHVGIQHSDGAYNNGNKGGDLGHGPSGGGHIEFDINDGTNINRFALQGNNVSQLDTGNHFAVTCSLSKKVVTLYVNGIKTDEQIIGSNIGSFKISKPTYIGGLYGGSHYGYLNDLRIYDHCLSAAEVKEVSKGLVLHYKLDDAYAESTTNLYNGGLGPVSCYNGSNGKYGFNNDTDFHYVDGIFQGRYCRKVYEGTLRTTNNFYPQFGSVLHPPTNGGYRTISFDLYPTQGSYITFYSYNGSGTVNSVSNGIGGYGASVPIITNQGNHLEVTIKSTSSATSGYDYAYLGEHTANNNYGLFANIQVEEKDHATGYTNGTRTATTVYDSSGYKNNGTIEGSDYSVIDINSGRYAKCTYFKSGTANITLSNSSLLSALTNCSCSFGFYLDSAESGLPCTGQSGSYYFLATSNNSGGFYHENVGSNTKTIYTDGTTSAYPGAAGAGHHYVITGLDLHTGSKLCINKYGSAGTSNNGNGIGKMSDFRLYSTVLSANDVAQLYRVGTKIDNNQNIESFEFDESSSSVRELNPHPTSGVTYLSDGSYTISGHTGPPSDYIPISPSGKTYYYDIEYSNVSGNLFYIGFEKYDANKASGSNSECQYMVATTDAATRGRVTGTISLATANGNTAAYTKLRILNDGNGTGNASYIGTIHHISLKEVPSTLPNNLSNITKAGVFNSGTFIEDNKVNITKTGNIFAKQFIEI